MNLEEAYFCCVNGIDMQNVPYIYRMIRGAVGKEFVIKHYKGGKIVKTKFPDMSRILPTSKQKIRRSLFKEAVVFARWIIADENRKWTFQKTLPRKKKRNVYQAALQQYLQMRGNKRWISKVLAVEAVLSAQCPMLREKKNYNSAFQSTYQQEGPWEVMWQRQEKPQVYQLVT